MSQEGQQLLVGGAVGPVGVDGVSVHRQKIARLRGLQRPEPAILLEVFHVQANGD